MKNHSTIARLNPDHNPENARGYFVQNRHGATVAGPFETMRAAWVEQDRLDLASCVPGGDPEARHCGVVGPQ